MFLRIYSLTVINGAAEIVLFTETDREKTELLEALFSAGEKAAVLCRQLLALNRKQIVQTRTINPGEQLAESRQLFSKLLGERIEFSLYIAPDTGMVTDNGTGMDAQTKAKLFDPFFTTRMTGTGLGLAICCSIINRHGGHIRFDSEVGEGSTFRVYLPQVDPLASTEPATTAALDALAPPTESILLVEDDKELRNFIKDSLLRAGYRVYCACNGQEALGIAKGLSDPVDLLLSDGVMPVMDGITLNALILT